MSAIYTLDGNELCNGLQGCNVCDEAIIAAERVADDRNEDVHLIDDDGQWLVHPSAGGEREDADPIAPVLARGANTSHEDAWYMYDGYGAYISTAHAGDVCIQAIEYDWLDTADDADVLAAHRDDLDPDMTEDECMELIALARSVRDDMDAIDSLLDDAVHAYEDRDLEGVLMALYEAHRIESQHGDAPATSDLRAKLIRGGKP